MSPPDAPTPLVPDNCEHVLGATAVLCAELLAAAPALHLLATSREPLGVDGEQVLVVGPLALPATSDSEDVERASATRLFDDRARGAGARRVADAQELAARVELCRRLDGVPLAIELAAARARSLTAVEVLALLDRRFDLLQRSAPVGRARHRSLRAAIDASYTLLDSEEQPFFRALGVFGGAFSAQLAHEVAAAPGFDLLRSVDALSRLVDRSLVTAEPAGGTTSYRLLESLRDYAAGQSIAAGEWDALQDRLVDATADEAVRIVAAGSERWSSELLAKVLALFETLVAALDRVVATDADGGRAFRLLLPLWGATHQGRAAEVAAVAERVLARWPAGGEPLRAEASAVAASALLAAGKIARATEVARPLRAEAPPLARIVALRTLGIAARYEGDPTAAIACFGDAREIAAHSGLAAFERELAVLGASLPRSGAALDAALAELDATAARAAAEDDRIGVVWARVVATHHFVRARRFAEARDALASAQQAQRDFLYPYGTKAALRLHAALETLERGWVASRPAWIAAIDGCADSGDLAELVLALRDAATLASQAGDGVAAQALRDAVPAGIHPVILGGIFSAGDGVGEGGCSRDLGAVSSPRAGLRRVREILRADAPPDATDPAEGLRSTTGALYRDGDVWTARFAERTTQLRHRKGIEDLAALLARPDEELHCLELIGGGDVGGDAGPTLDGRARTAYQERIRDLQAEIDRAHDANDPGHAERAEAELDALVQQLSEAFGLGGRARAAGSAAERARSAVSWRVRAAMRHIAELHPELGRHLANSVRTGTWCSYRPETPVAWEIATR
jgi:predicted ATPase